MAPAVLTRLEVWRGGRFWNGVIGSSLVVPAFLVMTVVGTLAGGPMRGPIPFDLSLLLALGGVVFGVTMPHPRTSTLTPSHPDTGTLAP